MIDEEFSELTKRMSTRLTKKTKQNIGFFATPNSIIKKLLIRIEQLQSINNFTRILEPSAGTLAFIDWINKSPVWTNNLNKITRNIDAIEYSLELYNSIKDIKLDNIYNKLNIVNEDFMKYNVNVKIEYDLIIGNPPYVIVPSGTVNKEYEEYIIGRPNLYCLFILHSIKMLKDNGILAFVIPKSFLNSLYYSKVRNYLMSKGNILDILDFDNQEDEDELKGQYIDTKQSTIGFIFKKTLQLNPNPEYALKMGEYENYVFTLDLKNLKLFLENSTTISKLGLKVKTGTIVWNQHKHKLTNDITKPLLIYNSNITEDHLVIPRDFRNTEKKQYINISISSNKPAILVNRGNGNTNYKLTFAAINLYNPDIPEYCVENHLNVISAIENTDATCEILNKVLNSLKNKKTLEFINIFCGNGGFSKTELETILPIWI